MKRCLPLWFGTCSGTTVGTGVFDELRTNATEANNECSIARLVARGAPYAIHGMNPLVLL